MVTLPTMGLEDRQESTEQIRLFILYMNVDNKFSFLSKLPSGSPMWWDIVITF